MLPCTDKCETCLYTEQSPQWKSYGLYKALDKFAVASGNLTIRQACDRRNVFICWFHITQIEFHSQLKTFSVLAAAKPTPNRLPTNKCRFLQHRRHILACIDAVITEMARNRVLSEVPQEIWKTLLGFRIDLSEVVVSAKILQFLTLNLNPTYFA